MILVLDNRDSFLFNLVQELLVLGAEVVVRRAERTTLAEIEALAPDRILIGPGPGRPEQAALSLALVQAATVPVLGICLGHQVLATAWGGNVIRARRLIHGQTLRVTHDRAGLFTGLPSPLAFTSYNSLVVDESSLPPDLCVTARSEDGEIMGLRHRDLPLEGVQFHPESIRSERGRDLLANFVTRPAPLVPARDRTIERPTSGLQSRPGERVDGPSAAVHSGQGPVDARRGSEPR